MELITVGRPSKSEGTLTQEALTLEDHAKKEKVKFESENKGKKMNIKVTLFLDNSKNNISGQVDMAKRVGDLLNEETSFEIKTFKLFPKSKSKSFKKKK